MLALGIGASYAGRLFSRWKAAFAIGAAICSLLIGVAAIFGPLVRRYLPDPEANQRGGIAGAFIYGLLYVVATVTTSAGPLFLLLTCCRDWTTALWSGAFDLLRDRTRTAFFTLGIVCGNS